MGSICGFCSLFCDQENLHRSCELRRKLLDRSRTEMGLLGAKANSQGGLIEEKLLRLKTFLEKSSNIHIGGSITSVETSRAVAKLAKKVHASLDGGGNGVSTNGTASLARSGAYLTTLAEARSISDCFIVIGSDRLLKLFPMLPTRLQSGRALIPPPGEKSKRGFSTTWNPVVLLLGEFGRSSIQGWKKSFPSVLSVPCDLERVPAALHDWSTPWPGRLARSGEDSFGRDARGTSQSHGEDEIGVPALLQRAKGATYTSLVWSGHDESSVSSDLWVQQLTRWCALMNETRRVAMLSLSGLESTFQQACTWLTGFPGPVRFRDDPSHPIARGENTAEWIARYGDDPEALLIYIEETETAPLPRALASLRCKVVHLTSLGESTNVNPFGDTIEIPIARPGVDAKGTMLRGDQIVMAHLRGEPEFKVPYRHECRSLLERLSS